ATSWADRTGIDKPMPMPGGAGGGDLGEWYRTVKVDLVPCRQYAQAVWASAAEFINGADETVLAKDVDMNFVGAGNMSVAVVFSVFVTGHLNNLCGEISAIKGANGLKGYPF
ncbi:MAG: hypothetical protein M3082_07295, partial [Candidatus Dormibacteraeota bacterium]|nr:hypothetical protein [Candidatus Dormibacteraeota bacterium]